MALRLCGLRHQLRCRRRKRHAAFTWPAGRRLSPTQLILPRKRARHGEHGTARCSIGRNFAAYLSAKTRLRAGLGCGMNFPGFWGESRHVQWGIAAVGSAALCGRASRSSEDGAVYVSPIPVRGGSAGAFSKVRREGAPRPRDDRRSSRADSVSPAENLLLPRVRPVHDAGPIDCAIGPASAAGHLALRGLRQDRNDRMPSLVRQQAVTRMHRRPSGRRS